MLPMPIADLDAVCNELAESGERVKVLWQKPDTLAFVARGREYRSEFHIDPADEVMYMIRGEMNLHFRTPEGAEDISVLKEGEMVYTAAGVPHSPRFPPDAFLLVMERKRRDGEVDRSSGSAHRAITCCTRRNSWSPTTPSIRSPRRIRRFSIRKNTAPARSVVT